MSSELDILKKRLEREKQARLQAEKILEEKALELYQANVKLRELNESLEAEVEARTKALLMKEKEYSTLIENANDIIYTTDEEGYFLSINDLGIRKFGMDKGEVLGRRYVEFVHPDYVEDIFAYYTKMKDDQLAASYLEFPIITKNGTVVWIGQNVSRILRPDGSFYYSAVARDITEKRDQELRLKRSEEKYRSMMENMELGLMEVDKDGNIQKVYTKFCKMVGYEPEEILGKNAADLFLDEQGKSIMGHNDIERERGKDGVYEIQIKCKGGEKKWILISGTPFYDNDGKFIGTLGIHYDISDRKALEEALIKAREVAEKAQEAEKEYLANMSHEIRNPIQGIIGMTELLQSTQLTGDQEGYLKNIKNASELLSSLVSDVLDLTKIDSGRIDVKLTRFNLRDVLDNIKEYASTRLRKSDVSFLSNFHENLPEYVVGDRLYLNQILMNIVGNAVKFTETGFIQMNVKMISSDIENVNLEFEIKDTGVGIEESKLSKIFNKYNQAGEAFAHKKMGAGLGLYIVNKLVDSLGGTVGVESTYGQGSIFRVKLPFKLESKTQSVSAPENIQLHPIKVMIVEDNEMNRMYIEATLNKLGHKWYSCENGLEAVDASMEQKYDLILMDIRMPEMDGYEATQAIRNSESNPNKYTPIIALTASALLDDKERAFKSGMNYHLTKPFSKSQLKNAIAYFHKSDNLDSGGPELLSNLDSDYLLSTYNDDWDQLKFMMEVFLKNADAQVSDLQSFLDAGDVERLKALLHKIKPGFTIIGFGSITEIVQDLESELEGLTGLDEDNIKKLNALISEFQSIIPLVKGSIERIELYLEKTQ